MNNFEAQTVHDTELLRSEGALCCCSGVTGLGFSLWNLRKGWGDRSEFQHFWFPELGRFSSILPWLLGSPGSAGNPALQRVQTALRCQPQNQPAKLGSSLRMQNGNQGLWLWSLLPGFCEWQEDQEPSGLGPNSEQWLQSSQQGHRAGLVWSGRNHKCPPNQFHSLGNKSRGRMEWKRAASKVPARGKDKTKSVFKLHACLNFALLLCHYFEKPKLCS